MKRIIATLVLLMSCTLVACGGGGGGGAGVSSGSPYCKVGQVPQQCVCEYGQDLQTGLCAGPKTTVSP
jgi:hypothetical protein